MNLHLAAAEPARSLIQTAPRVLDGPYWALVQSAAVQGGYDLRPYANQTLTFTAYPIVESSGGHAQTLWTINSAGKVVGAYIAVEDLAPGISGVGNPQ